MAAPVTFRRLYLNNLPVRVIDILLHIIVACITGSVWQFAPDVVLIVIWPYSMIVNRRLPEDSVLLTIHRSLHSLVSVMLLAVMSPWWHPLRIVAINWGLHWIIDVFTHRGWNDDLRTL